MRQVIDTPFMVMLCQTALANTGSIDHAARLMHDSKPVMVNQTRGTEKYRKFIEKKVESGEIRL
ncbi:hypothetical protein NVP1123O_69 [Vibrio phage 1.123.O._10N.286.48.F3]|nr:hypothetical protein NVP1123O_69 [Vibrio phage 1.123.O._10N.286.48.F3]